MIIQGRVVDAKSGKPLAGASITIMTKGGQNVGIGTAAGIDGVFSLSDSGIDGNIVAVSYVGYQTVLYDPGDLVSVVSSIVALQLKDETLQNVNVDANAATQAGGGNILMLLVALALIYFSMQGQKKKKMAGAENYVIPIGVVIGGYFLFKGVLGKLGLGTDKIDANKTTSDAEAAAAQKAAGSAPAVNDLNNRDFVDKDLQSIATQITDSTSGFFYDYTTLVKMMAYFSHFKVADAKKFLSLFVTVNGVTLYQWYRDKINNATLGNSGSIRSIAQAYTANFAFMNVTIPSFADSPQDFFRGCVSYCYKVAGLSMT